MTLVQTLKPDTTKLHVDKTDEDGNMVTKGTRCNGKIIMKAVKHMVVTAEKVVTFLVNSFEKQQITILGFLVDAIIQVGRGVHPYSCEGCPMSAKLNTTTDMMTCVMSCLLRDKEKIFYGVYSHIPMVAMILAKQLHSRPLFI